MSDNDKECSRCGVTKHRMFFSLQEGRPHGLRGKCKVCEAECAKTRANTGLSRLPAQPSAGAHRLWMQWEREMAA